MARSRRQVDPYSYPVGGQDFYDPYAQPAYDPIPPRHSRRAEPPPYSKAPPLDDPEPWRRDPRPRARDAFEAPPPHRHHGSRRTGGGSSPRRHRARSPDMRAPSPPPARGQSLPRHRFEDPDGHRLKERHRRAYSPDSRDMRQRYREEESPRPRHRHRDRDEPRGSRERERERERGDPRGDPRGGRPRHRDGPEEYERPRHHSRRRRSPSPENPRRGRRPSAPPNSSRTRPGMERRRSHSAPAKRSQSKSKTNGMSNQLFMSAAQTALKAGAATAYQMRDDNSPWLGEKGAKIAATALGAAMVDTFMGQKHPKKVGSNRHNAMREAAQFALGKGVLGGLNQASSRGYMSRR